MTMSDGPGTGYRQKFHKLDGCKDKGDNMKEKRFLRSILQIFILGLFVSFAVTLVPDIGGESQAAEKMKTLKQIKSEGAKRLGGKPEKLRIFLAPKNGKAKCSGGGQKCKCGGFCISDATGCWCEEATGIKGFDRDPVKMLPIHGR